MKLKQRPEDFVVTESWRFDEDPAGEHCVYLMDKQKLTTFDAVDRICDRFKLQHAAVSYCGLKDKQGRTKQLVAVRGSRSTSRTPTCGSSSWGAAPRRSPPPTPPPTASR